MLKAWIDAKHMAQWWGLTRKGRNETEIIDWVRLHDEYDAATAPSCCHAAKLA